MRPERGGDRRRTKKKTLYWFTNDSGYAGMIDFQNVSKLLGGRDIFRNVSFRVNKGERIGVVGPNGSGKTTLFSLISGDLTPDKGEIVKPEKARLGFLRQQLGFFRESEPLLSFAEAAGGELPRLQEHIIALEQRLSTLPQEKSSERESLLKQLGQAQSEFEALGGYEMSHRAAAALAGLGFRESDMQKPMGEFSGGWQMRAAMARVLLGEPDILLLDEPSNYLDIPAVEWLQRRLKNYEGTLLLISHDRYLLNSLTNITLEINGGNATRYSGGYSYYVREREERRRISEAAAKNNERKRQQLETNINRFRAKATKAAQVQSWIKMLDKMEEIRQPEDLHFTGQIRIPPPPPCGAAEILRLENVSHSYDGSRWILKDIDLTIGKGDKIGVIGYNGTGKSTLLRIIAGRFSPTEGSRRIGHKVVIGYQAQEFAELLPEKQSVFDVVREASAGIGLPSQRIREILGAFGFSGDAALKPCHVLSGGEKIRLCFARIFVNPPNLLVLDEPTTHLDIAAREALQEALKGYQGTVCLVSHDMEFLRGSANNILEMRSPGVRRYFGNYDYYKEKTASEAEKSASSASSSATDGKAGRNAAVASSPGTAKEKEAASGAAFFASSGAGGGTGTVVNPKELRRERAAKRQEMSGEKRRLEREIAEIEKKIESAEEEKSEILRQLSSPGEGIDFASLQKRLKEIDYTLALATVDWENTATRYEEFMKEYRKNDEKPPKG